MALRSMLAGILLALATSVSWALGNVFIQKTGRAIGAARAMLWSMAAGGVMSGVCAVLFDRRVEPVTAAVAIWTVVAGLAGLVAYVCLFHAFAHQALSVAVPLVSSWSLVSAALSLTILGERVRAGQAAGAVCVFLGVLLVSLAGARGAGPPAGQGPDAAREARRAVWAALGSGLGFGVMVPSMAHITPATGDFGAAALTYGVGLMLALPLARLGGTDLRPPPRSAWGLVLLTGVFETVGYVTVAMARRHAPMTLVAPIASMASTLTVLYAWAVLRERPPRAIVLGALLASTGIVILAL